MNAAEAIKTAKYRYRISRLQFNDGTSLQPGNLVVFVGPNNVGKSRSLRDILSICAPRPNVSPRPLVVTEVDWTTPPTFEDLEARDKLFVREEPNGAQLLRSLDPSLVGERTHQVTGWKNENFRNFFTNKQWFATLFGPQFVGHVGTQNRLLLVQQSQSPQFRGHATNLLQALYWKKAAVEQIQRAIKNQFDIDIALDFSTLAQIVLRVGKNMEPIPPDPRDASEILDKYERLDDQGDGLRSFTGIMTAVLCADRDVLFIDEPEAFLHPPQAFRIGELLAENVSEERQMFVATHSSDVLQGMLERASEATIVRLDRIGDENSFRVLDPADLKSIAVDPLLQSARVLEGVFYPAAMVVEADSDVRFYHAASHKLSPKADIHTVNAQNKQTVARVASLYRKLGLRCAGIVDFDVLNDGAEFELQLDALAVPEPEKQEMLSMRNAIAEFVEKQPVLERVDAATNKLRTLLTTVDSEMTDSCRKDPACIEKLLRRIAGVCGSTANASKPWSAFKESGRDRLSEELKVTFDHLAQTCARHGLFINSYGELESLLVDQGIEYTTDKKAWIRRALALIPNLKTDTSKRIWKLLVEIHRLLKIAE
ncbi:MAG TPA: AAA family ATPase [Terriglobales bacterium]|nr:AAA family ATPase [Terriglobales bacterium]